MGRIWEGPANPNWVGDKISVQGGRTRALRKFPAGACENCGAAKAERHHLDGNTANNEPGNIKMLCRDCHMRADGRRDALAAFASARAPELTAAAAAARRARTTCKRGHPLSGDNLYVAPNGSRICKACRTIHKREYRARGGKG